ncbi:MAG: hypothetical protein ACLQME_18785 [Alphaproteobacteria bacterium]
MRKFLCLLSALLFAASANAAVTSFDGRTGVVVPQAGDYPPGIIDYTYPGGSQRTLQSRLQDRVSVMDFGAKCDGSTNDTTAIQNALNAVASNGGEVNLPSNVKCLATNVSVPSSVTLDCQGSALSSSGTGNAPLFLNGINYTTIRNCWLYGYNAINVAGNTTEITFERLFLLPTNAGVSVTTTSDFERVGWYDVSFFRGNYGIYFVPGSGSTLAYIEKQFLYNPKFENQAISAIYLDGSNVTYSNTAGGDWLISGGILDLTGQNGIYISPGMRGDLPWEIISLVTEASPGYGQSGAITTCSATSGSANLTGCASTSGFTVGRQVNVAYAGSVYQDLNASITNIAGSTITLNTSASESVTNVTVNEAQYDLFYGLPSGSLIENVSCGGAGYNPRYFFFGAGGANIFIDNYSACGPVYASVGPVQIMGLSGLAVRRPSDYNSTYWQFNGAGYDLSSSGQQNYVSTPLGKDFVVSLADSVGNGSGTFGGFQVLSNVANVPDVTFRSDGQTGHITIGGLQPTVSCGTGATVQGGNDNLGRLRCGTSPGSTVVVTFASSSWPNSNAPVCEAADETSAATFRPSSVSTSAVTFTATGTIMASDVISWSCRSYF